MDDKNRLPGWMITILLAILGGVAGYIYTSLYNAGWLAQWQRYTALPEKAVSFRVFVPISWGDTADPVVETVSGRIYQYNTPAGAWDELVDFQKDDPQYIMAGGCNEHERPFPGAFFRLPAAMSACSRVRWSFEWFANANYYVVLENGSVWLWKQRSSPATSVSFLGWDELTAICIGWLAIWLYRLRPEDASKKKTIGYWLVGIGVLAAIFWLSRVVAPIASSFLLFIIMGFFIRYSILAGLLCGAGIAIVLIIIFRPRKNRFLG
jgi:hypothetical protein